MLPLYHIHTTTTAQLKLQFMHAFSICTTALQTTTAITQCKVQYYIHHMHVHTHTATTITTAQLRDNACIQYMRHCFRKRPPAPTSHSASYTIMSNHHYHRHRHHHDHHSTNYKHRFSICTTASGKRPPPPPSDSASYNITSNHHHHSTSYNACIQYMLY